MNTFNLPFTLRKMAAAALLMAKLAHRAYERFESDDAFVRFQADFARLGLIDCVGLIDRDVGTAGFVVAGPDIIVVVFRGTEDLLDRVTVYREEMEPEAVFAIEEELFRRGVTPAQIEEHRQRREEEGLWRPEGRVVRCSLCSRPAVGERRGWHRLWGVLPLFPRTYAYCAAHRPPEPTGR